MKVLGIIAEYNPFHNGHIYHIKQAKIKTGADYVIAVISGPFTQAGNISIQDKFSKAELALKNEVDLVIELPVIYAVSSASYFSEAAIKILDRLGIVDFICFGSESSNIYTLQDIANRLNNNEYKIWNNIKSQDKNISFAAAREEALKDILTEEQISIIKNSNDILGIEYLRAILKIKSHIKPECIQRNEKYKSATYIRNILETDKKEYIIKYVPKNSYKLLKDKSIKNADMFPIIKYALTNKTEEDLKNIKDISEGLENKILKSVISSNSYDELILSIKSKRYQMSKIKRILINILLNVTQDDFEYAIRSDVCYAHILKANSKGKKLLSEISKKASIPIITSLSKNKINLIDKNVLRYLNIDIKAQNIHSVICNDKLEKDYTNKI